MKLELPPLPPVDENSFAGTPPPHILEDIKAQYVRAAGMVYDHAIGEKRGLLADEKREVDRLDAVAAAIEFRLKDPDGPYMRLEDSARHRAENPHIYGYGTTGDRGAARGSDRIGQELRQAITDVKAGRSVAFVEYEDRAFAEGGNGGYGVGVEMKDPVFALSAKSALMSIPGIVKVDATEGDRMRFPRFNAVTVGGTAEGAALTAAATDLDAIDIVYQKFSTYETVSTELEEDFHTSALQALGERMLRDLAARVDLGFLEGTGAADTVGIFNQSGISTTSVAGLPADFDKVDEAIYQLELNDGTPGAWIMHPRSWRILNQIKTGIASDKTTLLAPNPQMAARNLRGLPVFTTSAISLTSGAGAGSTAAVVDPSQIVIVTRRQPRLEVSRDVAFATDQVAIRATVRVGLGVMDAAGGISTLTDIRAT